MRSVSRTARSRHGGAWARTRTQVSERRATVSRHSRGRTGSSPLPPSAGSSNLRVTNWTLSLFDGAGGAGPDDDHRQRRPLHVRDLELGRRVRADLHRVRTGRANRQRPDRRLLIFLCQPRRSGVGRRGVHAQRPVDAAGRAVSASSTRINLAAPDKAGEHMRTLTLSLTWLVALAASVAHAQPPSGPRHAVCVHPRARPGTSM